MVNERAEPFRVTVANPGNQPLTVYVRLRRPGQDWGNLRFDLPGGPRAGQSLTLSEHLKKR